MRHALWALLPAGLLSIPAAYYSSSESSSSTRKTSFLQWDDGTRKSRGITIARLIFEIDCRRNFKQGKKQEVTKSKLNKFTCCTRKLKYFSTFPANFFKKFKRAFSHILDNLQNNKIICSISLTVIQSIIIQIFYLFFSQDFFLVKNTKSCIFNLVPLYNNR